MWDFSVYRTGSVCLKWSDREETSSGSLDAQSGFFWEESWDEESERVLGEDMRLKEVRGLYPIKSENWF